MQTQVLLQIFSPVPGSQIPSLYVPHVIVVFSQKRSQECIWSLPSKNTPRISRATQSFQLWKAEDYVYDGPVLPPCSSALTWRRFATGSPSEREFSKMIMRKGHLLSCQSPIQMGRKKYTKGQKFASLTTQQHAAQILRMSWKGDQFPKLFPPQNKKKSFRLIRPCVPRTLKWVIIWF